MSAEKTTHGMVWFIGAGPGDPELITVKGKRLIEEADVVLYAGSLVPVALVACAKAGAEVIDSAPLNLEETHAIMRDAARAGKMVARVHTGDAALYGAMREQKMLLDADGIASRVVPGVTAGFAAAAAAGVGFTVPEVVQAVAFTRVSGRTPVPEGQRVQDYARLGGAVAIYLSAGDPEGIAEELRAGNVAEDTPVVLASRVGWPDEKVVHSTLAGLVQAARENGFVRQTVFLVLPGEREITPPASRLYAKEFTHGYREGKL